MWKAIVVVDLAIFAVAACLSSPVNAGAFRAGRYLEDNRDFGLRVGYGSVEEFEGLVEETTRKLYDVTGSYWKQDDAESFSLNDFGLDGPFPSFAVSMEKAWKYLTLQLDSTLLDLNASTVARRNYYIGVGDDIEFDGQSYDHMKIPKFTPFTVDMAGGTIEMHLAITPFTFMPADWFRVTPMLELGLFGFAGRYEIDAGPAQGVTQYQDPPVDFVVGGQASGVVGVGLPEGGGGLELRLGGDGAVNLVLQGHYTMMAYDGSTKYLTSSQHREKNVDMEHSNIRGRLLLEIPLRGSRSVVLGVQYQVVETEAFISSTATDPDEILEKQERFDKNVALYLESFHGLLGYTF